MTKLSDQVREAVEQHWAGERLEALCEAIDSAEALLPEAPVSDPTQVPPAPEAAPAAADQAASLV